MSELTDLKRNNQAINQAEAALSALAARLRITSALTPLGKLTAKAEVAARRVAAHGSTFVSEHDWPLPWTGYYVAASGRGGQVASQDLTPRVVLGYFCCTPTEEMQFWSLIDDEVTVCLRLVSRFETTQEASVYAREQGQRSIWDIQRAVALPVELPSAPRGHLHRLDEV